MDSEAGVEAWASRQTPSASVVMGILIEQAAEGVCPSAPRATISVVIVSWNARAFLQECLGSIACSLARIREVIVVDNESSDGSPEMVETLHPWVTLIRSGANLGFAKANNIAIGRSTGEYVCLINSDVHVLGDCLVGLAEFLDLHPEVGMVGPRVLWGDRKLQSSCRRFPSLWNNLCQITGLSRCFPKSPFFAGEHMFYFDYRRSIEVEVLVGCFIMARRSAIADVGLLDERFFMYGEDIDWSRRCWLAGWKVMFHPGAEAIHYAGGSSSNNRPRFSVEQQLARLQLLGKYFSTPEQIAFRLLFVAHTVMRLIRILFQTTLGLRPELECRGSIRAQILCLKSLMTRGPKRLGCDPGGFQ